MFHYNYLKSFKDMITQVLQLFKSLSESINSRYAFCFNPQVQLVFRWMRDGVATENNIRTKV